MCASCIHTPWSGGPTVSTSCSMTAWCVRVEQSPRYPMQMIIAVFDFAEAGSEPTHVPVLAVDEVRGEPLS